MFRNNKHLAKITPGGKTYYYGADNLGSTTVLFDEDGNVVWKGEISVFGDVVLGEWIGEELFAERVRFTGKDFDEVTGLYYFNARWYDPRLGRFTSEDPVRDGMNWHVYVSNNPLNTIDPTGLFEFKFGLGIGPAVKFRFYSDNQGNWDVDVAGGLGFGGLLSFDFDAMEVEPDAFSYELSFTGDIELGNAGLSLSLDVVNEVNTPGNWGGPESDVRVSGQLPSGEAAYIEYDIQDGFDSDVEPIQVLV